MIEFLSGPYRSKVTKRDLRSHSRRQPCEKKKKKTPFSLAKHDTSPLSLRLKSGGEPAHVLLEVAAVGKELDVGTVVDDTAGGLLLQVLLAAEGSEAPVLGDDDLLAAGELVAGAAESFDGVRAVWMT